MRVADTSALYAAFVAEDAHHTKARAALEDPEPVLICSEIFTETVALLQLRLGFQAARAAGRALRDLAHARVEVSSRSIASAAWEEYERADGRLSLPDSFVVAWCRSEGAGPLAFDRDLLKRAGGAG